MALFNPFRRVYSADELSTFRFLQKNQLFKELSHDELSYFLPFIYLREYRAEEVLYFRNDLAQALYIVKSGTVSISIDIRGNFELLDTKRTYQYVGETCLFPNARRLVHAIVGNTNAELYVIPQANLVEILERKPEIKAKMMDALATEYHIFMRDLFDAYRNNEGFLDLSVAYKNV
jgi:CRP/FNR family cyclic AMP-dependent transcriptional regulator